MGELGIESSVSSVVTYERSQDPHSTWKRDTKLAVIGSLVAVFIGIVAIPLYLKGNAIDSTGTDVIASVIPGTALRLDCGTLTQTVGNLVQVTWRKNMSPFYQQYSSGGRYRGHPTGEVGILLDKRLHSPSVGQIVLFPALLGDEGTYTCEVARVSDEAVGTEVFRQSFGVNVVSGPHIDLWKAGQIFASAFVAALFIFSFVRLSQRYRRQQIVEIITEPKPEEVPEDDDVLLSKSYRRSSRSNRSNVHRRTGSKRSSNRSILGNGRASPSSRRSACHLSNGKDGDNFESSKSRQLRSSRSCTSSKTSQRDRSPQRKGTRNKARQGRSPRK